MAILALVRRQAVHSLDTGDHHILRILYNLSGYGYVFAWGISFYPQLILNWRRKSTAGMSIGFQWYNSIGFFLYLIYTTFSPDSTVQDQIFAAHALLITALTLAQVPLYGVNKLGDFPPIHGKMIAGIVICLDIALALNLTKVMSSLSLVYAFGYIKDFISLVKYAPQLYLNWQRKSTVGFAMSMVFLDITGGVLSILQQVVSCKYDAKTDLARSFWSWEPFIGNKPKTLLGLIGIAYDCIFMYQHFALYGPKGRRDTPASVGHSSIGAPMNPWHEFFTTLWQRLVNLRSSLLTASEPGSMQLQGTVPESGLLAEASSSPDATTQGSEEQASAGEKRSSEDEH